MGSACGPAGSPTTAWRRVPGAAGQGTWCASSPTPVAPRGCARGCTSRRGIATRPSTERPATTTSTAISSPSCSPTTGDPNWSTMDPAVVPAPGVWSEAIGRALQHGDPAGSVWRPGETDTSIRPGWFHHPAEDDKVKSVAALTEIYFNSVGRNSKLLLNVPPTRDGVLHDGDVARLATFHDRLAALFAEDFGAGRHPTEHTTSSRTAVVEVDLGRSVTAGLVRLEEDIAHGQRVARYAVLGAGESGAWTELVRGQTIGYRKLDRFAPASVRRVRVVGVGGRAGPPARRIWGGVGEGPTPQAQKG